MAVAPATSPSAITSFDASEALETPPPAPAAQGSPTGTQVVPLAPNEGNAPNVPDDEALLRKFRNDNEILFIKGVLSDEEIIALMRELEEEETSQPSCMQLIFDPCATNFSWRDYFICAAVFFMPLIALKMLKLSQKALYWWKAVPKWYLNPFMYVQGLIVIALWLVVFVQLVVVSVACCLLFCCATQYSAYLSYLKYATIRLLVPRSMYNETSLAELRRAAEEKRRAYKNNAGAVCCALICILMMYYYFIVVLILLFTAISLVYWLMVEACICVTVLLHVGILLACERHASSQYATSRDGDGDGDGVAPNDVAALPEAGVAPNDVAALPEAGVAPNDVAVAPEAGAAQIPPDLEAASAPSAPAPEGNVAVSV